MTTSERVGTAVVFALAGWVSGCGSGDVSPTAGSAAPSASGAAFDTAGYCAKVCQRASTCGVEKAQAIARSGTDSDKATLERVKAEREGVEKSCVSDCNAKPPSAAEVGDARRAEACLQQPDCEALQACLEKL